MRDLISYLANARLEMPPPRQRVVLPEEPGRNIYVIGDVHGRLDLLRSVEDRIRWDAGRRSDPSLVVMLGDYVDRGPSSRDVIDHLMKPMEPPFQRICLCGNHDEAFLSFITADEFDPGWFGLGAMITLQSYGIDVDEALERDPDGGHLKQVVREVIPEAHVAFLEQLPICASTGKYLFVHAGIFPGVPLAAQEDSDMLWIREPFLTRGPELDLMVIHGHTPTEDFQYGPGRIGIDTGAFATGKLKALHISASGSLKEI